MYGIPQYNRVQCASVFVVKRRYRHPHFPVLQPGANAILEEMPFLESKSDNSRIPSFSSSRIATHSSWICAVTSGLLSLFFRSLRAFSEERRSRRILKYAHNTLIRIRGTVLFSQETYTTQQYLVILKSVYKYNSIFPKLF